MRFVSAFFGSLSLLYLGGCALPGNSVAITNSSVVTAADSEVTSATQPRSREIPKSGQHVPGTPLTLEETLAVAARSNPTFAEFQANRQAAAAEVIQALAYPNPEAEGSLDLARSRGEMSGEKSLEFGLSLVQPFELPGKRRARRAAAEASLPIVEREEAAFRVTLAKEVTQGYATVLYYEQALQTANENARLASEIEAVVGRRVDGGEAPEVDRIKARLESLQAKRAVQSQQRRVGSARAVLNALCGGTLGEDFTLAETLESVAEPLALETSLRNAQDHPLLRRVDAALDRQRAIIGREESAWYPDLKPGLQVGQEDDKNSIGVSLGVEIPLFNRNQGGIAGAKAELARLEAERERVRIEVERDVHQAWQAYQSSREQAGAFGDGLREGAAEALRIETFLYEQGETDFLRLLEARRTARATEAEYLQALFDARIARAELNQVMGIGENKP